MKNEGIFLQTGIIFLSALVFAVSCGTEDKGHLLTVKGPVDPEDAGITLTHEHILVDFIGADSSGSHRYFRDSVITRALPELNKLHSYGVRTFIDCTPEYLGRDPLILKALSDSSGIHILTNTGFYGARNNKFIHQEVKDLSPEEIAAIWIREFEEGIDGTGIRPGFIKIAVDPGKRLSKMHRKLIHAAALTHRETGMVIASHTGPEDPAFEQLAVIKEYGLSADIFIWVHAQRGNIEAIIEAAGEGAWISLDNIDSRRDKNPGDPYSSEWYANRLGRLKDEGLLHKVLLSNDAGWYSPGEIRGGSFRGFTDLFDALLPILEERGFTEEEISQMMVRNPAEAFRIRH